MTYPTGTDTMLAQRPLCAGPSTVRAVGPVPPKRAVAPALRLPPLTRTTPARPLTMRVRSGPPAADAAIGLGAAGDSASNGKSSVVCMVGCRRCSDTSVVQALKPLRDAAGNPAYPTDFIFRRLIVFVGIVLGCVAMDTQLPSSLTPT